MSTRKPDGWAVVAIASGVPQDVFLTRAAAETNAADRNRLMGRAHSHVEPVYVGTPPDDGRAALDRAALVGVAHAAACLAKQLTAEAKERDPPFRLHSDPMVGDLRYALAALPPDVRKEVEGG